MSFWYYFALHFGPAAEIKTSSATVWNDCMTSPAVSGPLTDSSRLRLCHWSSSAWDMCPFVILTLNQKSVSLLQIAIDCDCFRRHTVAFVASTSRLYTFGLGGNGQLGIGSKTNCLTPTLVPNVSSVVSLVSVHAGGDQCVAVTAKVCRYNVKVFNSLFQWQVLMDHVKQPI